MSGSKVFGAQYEAGPNARTKTYVLKVGSREKIEAEAKAIREIAAPNIDGVNLTASRHGLQFGVLAQELAGLTGPRTLRSLRNYVRNERDGDVVITRLLRERLQRLYAPKGGVRMKTHKLGTLMKRYLRKADPDAPRVKAWSELRSWVATATGERWHEPEPVVSKLKLHQFRASRSMSHGDLHSQNVLLDERGEVFPIDFAWCSSDSSPLVDVLMLEASLKFLAIPMRSDLRSLLEIEHRLAQEYSPSLPRRRVPYSEETTNVLKALQAVRSAASTEFGIAFEDYRKALCLMTYSLASHPHLNRPYVLASLQILAGIERRA